MACKKDTEQHVVNVSVDRLWASLVDGNNLIPKICPEFIKSIDVHADGTRFIQYGPVAVQATGNTYAKEKMVVDEATKTVIIETIEGAVLGKAFESLKVITNISPGKDQSTTIATMEVEYVPIGDADSKKLREGSFVMLKALEAYLQANPAVYA